MFSGLNDSTSELKDSIEVVLVTINSEMCRQVLLICDTVSIFVSSQADDTPNILVSREVTL